MESLASAIMARRVEDVRHMLENPRKRQHIRLNGFFSDGRNTRLILAVLFNSVSIVKVLLDEGADPTICGITGTPLSTASQVLEMCVKK